MYARIILPETFVELLLDILVLRESRRWSTFNASLLRVVLPSLSKWEWAPLQQLGPLPRTMILFDESMSNRKHPRCGRLLTLLGYLPPPQIHGHRLPYEHHKQSN